LKVPLLLLKPLAGREPKYELPLPLPALALL
jgi:hypothetical protein